MKIGLLECDHVLPELREIGGDYRDMFPSLLKPWAPDWEFEFFDVVNGQFPPSVTACDAYICTGSRFSVYDDEPWIHQLQAFVREISQANVKYVGICFGHQLLGAAMGGEVAPSPNGWCVGVHDFELLVEKEFMLLPLKRLRLLMMCQDQILVLPPNSEVLASADKCPNAMIQVGENMLGIQAHPEFPKEYNQALMNLRVERIGQEKVEQGIKSLQSETDEVTFGSWLVEFVRN